MSYALVSLNTCLLNEVRGLVTWHPEEGSVAGDSYAEEVNDPGCLSCESVIRLHDAFGVLGCHTALVADVGESLGRLCEVGEGYASHMCEVLTS